MSERVRRPIWESPGEWLGLYRESWQGEIAPESFAHPAKFSRALIEEGNMIFDALYESAQRGELLLVDGGFCHWHLRRDGQLTIREIISTRPGAGSEMLAILKRTPGATSIFAKCPATLEANGWYARQGFVDKGTETTRTGRVLRLWRLFLN